MFLSFPGLGLKLKLLGGSLYESANLIMEHVPVSEEKLKEVGGGEVGGRGV